MIELLLRAVPWGLEGDRREQLLYVLSLGAVVTGTLGCLAALRVPSLDVLAAAVAGAAAGAWLLANAPAEGAVVLEVLPDNGVTVADLVVVPAGLLVGWLGLRRLLDARRPCSPPAQAPNGR